ncbi:MAG TPA: hypothetical protein VHV75_03175 [Solirubrobacteraceae bacterium]|jgi:hypothetical protein|nr:hypothetical protein [Solirubrobacteraceae bacterium]
MSLAKVAVVCALTALLVSACGIAQKPLAGSPKIEKAHTPGFYGVVDDPRKKHVPCLRADKLRFREYRTGPQHLPAIQVGSAPAGPTIVFYPTPGTAQALQLQGEDEGAEAIGSALLYPNNASGSELTKVENCTSIGVTG